LKEISSTSYVCHKISKIKQIRYQFVLKKGCNQRKHEQLPIAIIFNFIFMLVLKLFFLLQRGYLRNEKNHLI